MRTVSEGQKAVAPWIVSREAAKLIAFMKGVFDAREDEGSRVTSRDGTITHAELRIGDSVVLTFDAGEDWPPIPAFLRLSVEDGEATFRRALAAGATPVARMTSLSFGDRVGRVRDAWGNLWWIHQHAEDVDKTEWTHRVH